MELFFNSVWGIVAVASVCLWLRLERRSDAQRHASFIALAMLIVILFPVISVSDDIWAAQNPAETDTSQRRDHRGCCSHSPSPMVAALPESFTGELSFDFQHGVVPRYAQLPAIANPALDPIENRPPPAA